MKKSRAEKIANKILKGRLKKEPKNIKPEDMLRIEDLIMMGIIHKKSKTNPMVFTNYDGGLQ